MTRFLQETLNNNFRHPKDAIKKYEKQSIFALETKNTSNLDKLKKTKIRLYTEPDTLWWKENSMADYEQMNAFYIKKLAENLTLKGYERVEYISTMAKGYRANGERHPHSWSIVNTGDLINWILSD